VVSNRCLVTSRRSPVTGRWSLVVSFTAHAYLFQTSLALFETIKDYDNS
jgi:hypothetical protein